MTVHLKSCGRCGGDVLEEEMPGYPPETVCLQCGRRAQMETAKAVGRELSNVARRK